jgi:hypothetical protein
MIGTIGCMCAAMLLVSRPLRLCCLVTLETREHPLPRMLTPAAKLFVRGMEHGDVANGACRVHRNLFNFDAAGGLTRTDC